MKPTLLIAIHGVEFGEIKDDFANVLFDGVKKNISCIDRENLKTFAYNWTKFSHPRQITMFGSVESGLNNREFRKLKHTIGSDVSWTVGRGKQGTKCFLDRAIEDLSIEIAKYPDYRIVIFGHSQGSQVALNSIWDINREISLFVSAGSPITMNSGMFDDWGKVPQNLKRWVNLYNVSDFISSMIQGVHPSKEIADFVEDCEVPLGWYPIYWKYNIKSMKLWGAMKAHLIYWKSDFVHKKIAKLLLA